MDLTRLIIILCRVCGCLTAALAVYGVCVLDVSYVLFGTLMTILMAYLGVRIEDEIHFDD